MEIVVPIKIVPDLVEELELTDDGKALDMTFMRLIINEFDEHAIEQAILLKERGEATVTVIAPDMEGADDALFSAGAKGADRLIKLTGEFEEGVNNHALSRAFHAVIADLSPDLILTGVQAHDDLDGSIGSLLAEMLEMPYVGYIAGVRIEAGKVVVEKEYPGGLSAEMEEDLPAVVGIQAADEPPRYVPISKVRSAMKSLELEEIEVADLDPAGGLQATRMYLPESGERAEMLEGDEQEVAKKLSAILKDLGVIE